MMIRNIEKLQEKVKTKSYFLPNFKARIINESPYIVKINNFVSDDEIKDLLDMSEGKFERSNIVLNGELTINDMRTSRTAYICKDGLPDQYSKNIERLIKRIRYLTGCKREQIEGLMVVKYKYMEKFDAHVDYFKEEEINVLDQGEQRIITFFVYLNDVPKDAGGETEFTKLGIKSYPKKGDCLFWENRDFQTGEMLPLTEHRGNPIMKDGIVKYGVNIWIRESSFY